MKEKIYRLFRVLFCAKCKAWTEHELSDEQDEYICKCGEAVLYIVNDGRPQEAIKLT